jgi:RNA-directed DNA polymerase
LYLNQVDKLLERAREITRYNGFTVLEYARFADDLVVLVSAHPNQRWLHSAVEKRLREEFAKLEVEVNEGKSRRVDLKRGESFSFLGFDFWRVRSRAGRWDGAVSAPDEEAHGVTRPDQGYISRTEISTR